MVGDLSHSDDTHCQIRILIMRYACIARATGIVTAIEFRTATEFRLRYTPAGLMSAGDFPAVDGMESKSSLIWTP